MNYQQITTQYPNLDIIPLRPFSKKPISKGWQTKSPQEQWENANIHCNYGIRTGNGVVIFDADNKQTEEKLYKLFPKAVIAKTFSGGRHFFIRVDDFNTLEEVYPEKFKRMTNGYKGEMRHGSGAYTVIAPSVVNINGVTGKYSIIQGSLDNIPTYNTDDILDIISQFLPIPQSYSKSRKLVHLMKFDYSVDVENMLIWLSSAEKGESYEGSNFSYPSRSETEFAVVRRLMLCGYSLEDVYKEFDFFQCGHYIAKPESYLEGVYNRVVENHFGKKDVKKLQHTYLAVEQDRELPFRVNLVLRALLSTGIQFNKINPTITKYSIVRATGILNTKTISNCLEWLENNLNVTVSEQEDFYSYDLSDVIKNYAIISTLTGLGRFPDDISGKGSKDGYTQLNQVSIQTFENLSEALHYEYKLGETRYKIMNLLHQSSHTAKELAEKIGVTTQNIYYHTARLRKEELIHTFKGVFSLVTGDILDIFELGRKVTNTIDIVAGRIARWEKYCTELKIGKDGAKALTRLRSMFKVQKFKKQRNFTPKVKCEPTY